jgi:predicted tellurium resistance membrane protein TerC
MELLSDPAIWLSFATLCLLEIVLGIDNLIFISILTNKLPVDQQAKARNVGLSLALIMRLGLLFSISWIMGLTEPLFEVAGFGVSGRDLIMLIGGVFLIYKSVKEIHEKLENAGATERDLNKTVGFNTVITQIILIDLVFSFDSVITAVGMVDHISVMIAAVLVSMMVMLVSATSISGFVNRHPAIKVLALAFLIMIGVALIAEGLHFHFPKAYIYCSMAFALVVELINIRIGSRKNASA